MDLICECCKNRNTERCLREVQATLESDEGGAGYAAFGEDRYSECAMVDCMSFDCKYVSLDKVVEMLENQEIATLGKRFVSQLGARAKRWPKNLCFKLDEEYPDGFNIHFYRLDHDEESCAIQLCKLSDSSKYQVTNDKLYRIINPEYEYMEKMKGRR